jgi:hypothetical protein
LERGSGKDPGENSHGYYPSMKLVVISKLRSTLEKTTPDFRNTPSTTNPEEEEIVDAPGKDGNASMPEQVKRPNPWRKMMMMTLEKTADEVDI